MTQRGISTRQTGNLHNKEKTFQDQQIDEDLDLNWVQFKYRNHDPQIGRFIEVGPLSEDYVYNSTYAFSENQVTGHVELEGLEASYINPDGQFVPASDNLRRPIPRGSIVARPPAISKQTVSSRLDFFPWIGDVKGFKEGITGRDSFTGEKLGWDSRLLGIVFLSELRTLTKTDELIDAAETLSKEPKQVYIIKRQLKHFNK